MQETDRQYIMGLLYKKDEFLDRYVCVQDNKGQLAMFQTVSKQGNVLSLCHHTSTVHYINILVDISKRTRSWLLLMKLQPNVHPQQHEKSCFVVLISLTEASTRIVRCN